MNKNESKNNKRELFFIESDVSPTSTLNFFQHHPKLTAEFGYHHERFLNLMKKLSKGREENPLHIEMLNDFSTCKDEYDCLLAMKEDLENRINQAIDNIDKLLNGVSDETLATELKQIKQDLWKTGKNRWLEIFWNIERDTNSEKNEAQTA